MLSLIFYIYFFILSLNNDLMATSISFLFLLDHISYWMEVTESLSISNSVLHECLLLCCFNGFSYPVH